MNRTIPKIIATVGSVVLKRRSILFVRQTYGKLKNKWSLPWGFVEAQSSRGIIDTPDKAAERETFEEAGVKAKVKRLIAFQNLLSKRNGYMAIFVFQCKYITGNPRPDKKETSEAKFMNLKQISQAKNDFDKYSYWISKRVLNNNYRTFSIKIHNPYSPSIGFY